MTTIFKTDEEFEESLKKEEEELKKKEDEKRDAEDKYPSEWFPSSNPESDELKKQEDKVLGEARHNEAFERAREETGTHETFGQEAKQEFIHKHNMSTTMNTAQQQMPTSKKAKINSGGRANNEVVERARHAVQQAVEKVAAQQWTDEHPETTNKVKEFQRDVQQSYQNFTTEHKSTLDHTVVEFTDPGKMEDPLCTRIFVRGFTIETSKEDICDYFTQWGNVVRVDLKNDYHTNESRGFGFVTMATPAEYRKVFEHPSGHRLKGNDLRLKEAKKSLRARVKGKGKGKGNDMASMMMKMMGFDTSAWNGWQGGGEKWWDQNKTTGGPKHKDDDRKIFVGGLAGEVGEHHLREHFKQFGDIELVELKMHPTTGKCRGFAFVTFSNEESASAAINNRKGNVILNKLVGVKTCGDHSANSNPQGDPDDRTMFVGGLPWDITTEKLSKYFDTFGRIQKLRLSVNEQTGRPKGFAFIIFAQQEDADTCLKEPVHIVEGHSVDVKIATGKKSKDGDEHEVPDWAAAYGMDAETAAQYSAAMQQQQQLMMYQQHVLAQQQLMAAAAGGDAAEAAPATGAAAAAMTNGDSSATPTAEQQQMYAMCQQQYMQAMQAAQGGAGADGAAAYGAAATAGSGSNRFTPY